MLEIKELSKSFGDNKVLKGISLNVKEGSIVGLVGKNGAGKTTLFHSLLNFLDYQGDITLNGLSLDEKVYNQIGYLPEERSLMPKLTVREQINYLASLKGLSRKDIKERLSTWMERLEVKGKETDKIKSLSKGNQQKLQLIATLIHEPDLIILDEPFSGLDPVNASILKEVIKAERERGAMIIFSDHNMANVEELCDQVVLLSQGNIALQGTIKEVRESFGKTRLFVSSQLTKDELEELPHVISASKTQLGSWCLTLDNENAGKELFTVLTKGDYIQTFDQQAPSLDEIFRMKAR